MEKKVRNELHHWDRLNLYEYISHMKTLRIRRTIARSNCTKWSAERENNGCTQLNTGDDVQTLWLYNIHYTHHSPWIEWMNVRKCQKNSVLRRHNRSNQTFSSSEWWVFVSQTEHNEWERESLSMMLYEWKRWLHLLWWANDKYHNRIFYIHFWCFVSLCVVVRSHTLCHSHSMWQNMRE